MIGSVSPAMHRYFLKPATWVLRHRLRLMFRNTPYSMYENRCCRDYRDGRVTKEQLDSEHTYITLMRQDLETLRAALC